MVDPSEPQKRRRITRAVGADQVVDDISCCFCQKNIPYNSECVQLQPCKCSACTKCLLNAHAERGKSLLSCPCGSSISSHKFLSAARIPNGDPTNYATSFTAENDTAMQRRYPYDYIASKKKDEIKSMANDGELLCLWGMRVNKSEQGKIKTSQLLKVVLRHDSVSTNSGDGINDLCNFFAWLCPSIIKPSLLKRGQIETLSPREFLEDAYNKYSPLMALLFGLATGNSDRDGDKILKDKDPDYQSQYLAIAVAHDIVLRSNIMYPYRLNLMLNNQMEMEKVSKVNVDLLSSLRILPSRKFTDKNMCNAVVRRMIEGVELEPWAMIFFNFDNIGFKILGLLASYSSYTLMQEIYIRKARLTELNIYNDDPTKQLSRKRTHNWIDLCAEDNDSPGVMELAKSIVENTQEDFDLLTYCIGYGILHAKTIVIDENLASGKCIPNPAYIVDEDTYKEVEQKASIRRGGNTTVQVTDDDNDDDNEYQPDVGSATNSDAVTRELPIVALAPDEVDLPINTPVAKEVPTGNMYGDNTTLTSFKEDLSKTETVAAIMSFAWESRRKLIKKWRDEEGDPEKLPAAEIGVFLMCDGQPAHQITTQLAQDNNNLYCGGNKRLSFINYGDNSEEERNLTAFIEELDGCKYDTDTPVVKSKFHDKLFVGFGVFHATLKMHNCRGLMFVTMLDVFFSAFRNTPGRRKWVINPSDPRQVENELPQITCAHYASAFINCREEFINCRNKSDETPSVKDVHDYMKRRAEKFPFLKAVLNEIRYAEITKMMKMSAKLGKRGSIKLWLATVRFALPLWATTHATEYVRLGCDLLRCWHCFSQAEKELYANEVFTRLTSNGKPEAADLNMEKSVLHVRQHLGKVDRPAMEKKMEGACHKIPNQKTARQARDDLRGRQTGDDGIADNDNSRRRAMWLNAKSPLLKAFQLIHDEQTLWDYKHGPTLKMDGNNRVHVKEGSHDIPMSGGKKIIINTNNCYAIGQDRVTRYFHIFNVATPCRVDRTEKEEDGGVDLGRLLATTTDREEELTRLLMRGTSVNEAEVSEVFIVRELDREITKLVKLINSTFDMTVEGIPPGSKAIKKDKVKKLVELRSIYFGQDSEARERITAEIKFEFSEKYPEVAIHDEVEECVEMLDDWWSLSDKVWDNHFTLR